MIVQFVDVQDSHASATIEALPTDTGNNINWNFATSSAQLLYDEIRQVRQV